MKSSVLALVAAAFAAPAAGQTPTARMLETARDHIGASRFDSADAALRVALDRATYQMDTVGVLVWRAILEHLRGSDSLARLSIRQALALNPGIQVSNLTSLSPTLSDLFESERRAARVYLTADVDPKPARIAGPAVVYPADMRRRRVAGLAVVRAVVDTLGRVEPKSVEVLDAPDSAFTEPLKVMMAATTFTPGQIGGRPVRTRVSLSLTLTPPAPPSAATLVASARRALAAGRSDSTLALLEEALHPATGATDGERAYALLVQGLAWRAAGRDSLAAAAFDAGLAGYRELTARGVDLAPFLRRLADSIRTTRRTPPPAVSPLAGTTTADAVDARPAVISHPPIRYAPEMQALRIGGTVIVEATLDTTGRVVPATVRIVQSPNPVFDAEAKRVVLATVYRPATRAGQAIRVVIKQPITFAAY